MIYIKFFVSHPSYRLSFANFRYLAAGLILCALPLAVSLTAEAAIPDKSANDVFEQTVILANLVRKLRHDANIDAPWPNVPPQSGKAPRHVLQKSLEIIKKINRLRVIWKMGEVSIPPFPSRDITPNEVFAMVKRLVGEMRLLAPGLANKPAIKPLGKSSDDVYRQIWTISLAIDSVLGVRGFTPSDVYAQSVRVVELVKFLRLTQNVSEQIEKPKRPSNRHSNHAIAAAYQLLGRIAEAERNLWMEPAGVPKVPNPVVTPTEVYDALQIVIAELQRIKYRIGVQRHIRETAPVREMTPDDVIVNLQWATLLMPSFALDKPLYQLDPASLTRNPRDVFNVTEHIIKELERFKAARGNRTKPRIPPHIPDVQPKHVFQKALDALEKLNLLRVRVGLGKLVQVSQPLRIVTPDEVYDLSVRLDAELEIVYRELNVSGTTFFTDEPTMDTRGDQISAANQLSVNYFNMWRISYLLDSILGSIGFSPTDVYRKVQKIIAEIRQISRRLGRYRDRPLPPLESGQTPADVIGIAEKILEHIAHIRQRAGMYGEVLSPPRHGGKTHPNDVHNTLSVLMAEVVSLKAHLGIDGMPEAPNEVSGIKTSSDVHRLLKHANHLLFDVLPIDVHGASPGLAQ